MPGSSVHGIPQARILKVGSNFLLQGASETRASGGSTAMLVSEVLGAPRYSLFLVSGRGAQGFSSPRSNFMAGELEVAGALRETF